jgi:hypothetical protein
VRINVPGTRSVDVEALRAGFERMGRAVGSLRPVVVQFADEFHQMRHRMLVTNLMRTRTFEEATAIVKLRDARRIRNGARRHRAVKHARDLLRAARKQADRTYP